MLELENLAGGDLRAKSVTPIFAGFLTGALFKCTSGPRGAALAGSFGKSISCLCIGHLHCRDECG